MMASTDRKTRRRRPTHPGEMLREDFMPDYGVSVAALAKALGITRKTAHEVLSEKRGLSPAMALRLGRLFENNPEFWMEAQLAVDLWDKDNAPKRMSMA